MKYMDAVMRNNRDMMIEKLHSVVLAAYAMGTNPDVPDAREIEAEMDSRLAFAFKQYIDNEGFYDEQPAPADDGELPY